MNPETFGLQAAEARGDLPAEWQALVAAQASTLALLVSRMQTAAAILRQRKAPATRWQALAAEAERVLTEQAQGQVRLERELVALRALVTDFSTRPADMVARVRTLESAIEVLHGNLATARQYLATILAREE